MLALFAMTTGAWADWGGGTYTATTEEDLFDDITVNDDATLTINEGVTVTVRFGITISEGKTLTVVGPGTLKVNGTDGSDGSNGSNGSAAVSGNIVVKDGAKVTANGGGGGNGNGNGGNGGAAFAGAVTIYGGTITANGGNGGGGGNGGNGAYAFAGTLTYYGGSVIAYGGDGGGGGDGGSGGGDGGYGSDGKAFASAVTFVNAPTSLTNGEDDIDQNAVTNYRFVMISGPDVAPEPTIELDWNKDTKQATFEMPAANVELRVEYYPGLLTLPAGTDAGTVTVEGMTDTALPEGFEKDDDGNICVKSGTQFTLIVTPAENYRLVSLSDGTNTIDVDDDGKATITMTDDDLTLTATFSDEYDITFKAANDYTIDAGKATVKVGDDTATPDADGKLQGVKAGKTVTLNAVTGYKFRKVEAKNTKPATLKDALVNGATVVITYVWSSKTTTFTFTNNGGTFTGNATGDDAGNFTIAMAQDGETNFLFGAQHQEDSADANVVITFYSEINGYSFNTKGAAFESFTISVNGTDVTSQLTELK